MAKQSAVVCDLDGTLAIHNGRKPFEYHKCDTDLLNEKVSRTIRALVLCGVVERVVYVSGREGTEECRRKTEAWLDRYVAMRGPLFMRAAGDYRPDDEVKEEIYHRDIEPDYDVFLVLDDRTRVVNRWRELGLTCWQVAPGEF